MNKAFEKLTALILEEVEPLLSSATDNNITGKDRFFPEFSYLKDSSDYNRKQFEKELKQDKDLQPLAKLFKILGDATLARRLLELCLVCLYQPDFSQRIASVFGTPPTLEICEQLFEQTAGKYNYRDELEQAKLLLLVTGASAPHLRQTLSADDVLFDYITGQSCGDDTLKYMTEKCLPKQLLQQLFINQAMLHDIEYALCEFNMVQLLGGEGCGRKLLLKHACHNLKKPVMLVDTKALMETAEEKLANLVYRIRREALLHDYVICFFNIESENDVGIGNFLKNVVKPLEQIKTTMCFVTGSEVHIVPQCNSPIKMLPVPEPDRNERTALWEGYGRQYGLDSIDWVVISNKFKMTAHRIKKVMDQLVMREKVAAVDEKAVADACNLVLPPAQGDFHAVNSRFTLDDLKLPDTTKDTIHNICAHVLYRHKVYDEWDLESKFTYGKSVSALFVGAPGTGKTMAVHVISNMLGIPIYQVDLSQIVDKYIGETEKHLERIFDRAQNTNTILFFDEADSVFGKRSDVNEAKDKFANTQVSYILQRLEQYDGIVILASNYRQNIDDAVMRRIRYLVEFQFPGEETRRTLWQSVFSDKTPIDDIDYDFLAFKYEFAGGSMRHFWQPKRAAQ